MRSIIILDQSDSRFNYIPSIENINSQIIIKEGEYGYNFNADVAESLIGRCQRTDMLLLSIGCRQGIKYRRECKLDPPQLIIYEEEEYEEEEYEESQPNCPHRQARTTYINRLNEIRLTVEN